MVQCSTAEDEVDQVLLALTALIDSRKAEVVEEVAAVVATTIAIKEVAMGQDRVTMMTIGTTDPLILTTGRIKTMVTLMALMKVVRQCTMIRATEVTKVR